MAEYKLVNALPQSAPGNVEQHFGHTCKIKLDGVWIELDEMSANNFLAGGHIAGPVISDQHIPQSMTDAMVNGSGRRKYKRKDKDNDELELAVETSEVSVESDVEESEVSVEPVVSVDDLDVGIEE